MQPPETDAVADALGALELGVCDGCDECGLRCTAGVPMSCAEYGAIREYLANAAHKPVCSLGLLSRPQPVGEGYTFEVCRFRDRDIGRCVVYPVRPLVCRLMGHVPWMPCPTGRVTQVLPEGTAIGAIRAYARLVRRSFEEWDVAGFGEWEVCNAATLCCGDADISSRDIGGRLRRP